MPESYKKLLENAHNKKKENRKFYRTLSRRKDLDQLFHPKHEEAFEHINCLECANCCKTTSPIFRDVDIDRISKHLGMRPSEFTTKYLHIDEDDDWVLNTAPCPFLDKDNRCTIYEVRPKACREYPHTDRKNMAQILDITYRNALICPAVAEITEKIKKEIR
ncbi:MAG: YkgJ family cysteine cluster protein [Bacteroidetes bacterium]|nr:YkgJ family cysteine cluster protein [Bacteroidota bacterium]